MAAFLCLPQLKIDKPSLRIHRLQPHPNAMADIHVPGFPQQLPFHWRIQQTHPRSTGVDSRNNRIELLDLPAAGASRLRRIS